MFAILRTSWDYQLSVSKVTISGQSRQLYLNLHNTAWSVADTSRFSTCMPLASV